MKKIKLFLTVVLLTVVFIFCGCSKDDINSTGSLTVSNQESYKITTVDLFLDGKINHNGVTINPGSTHTIENLPVGNYSIRIQFMANGKYEFANDDGIVIKAGERTIYYW